MDHRDLTERDNRIEENRQTGVFRDVTRETAAPRSPEAVYEGVYVHTPFCLQKCLYCDFPSRPLRGCEEKDRYVEALCREIRLRSRLMRAEHGGTLPVNPEATVYFGGGTPTVLTADQLERIVTTLKEEGWWRRPAEATVEANPGTVDGESLRRLRNMGFDRISFGIQSLQDSELKAIGRVHTAAEAEEAVALAREAGFRRISGDLMAGLPGQTPESLRDTLEKAACWNLEHHSVYSLILEEGTPLYDLVEKGRVVLPPEEDVVTMDHQVRRFMEEQGLRRYEVSNYARPGEESRHNLVYWHYRPYMAFGPGACTFTGTERLTGTTDLEEYCRAFGPERGIDTADSREGNPAQGRSGLSGSGKATLDRTAEGILSSYTIEELSPEIRLEEFLIMGLRLTEGISLEEARTRFGVDVMARYGGELAPFLERGMVEVRGGFLRLTEDGMQFGNLIFEVFVNPL